MKSREAWLRRAVSVLAKEFPEGVEVPPLHPSVGWPKTATAVGECWNGAASADGRPHIFVSPELAEPVEVLETLLHEMVHAAVKVGGHRGAFARVAAQVGLVPPWKDAPAGPERRAALLALAARLGPYGHPKLSGSASRGRGADRPGSRLRLFACSCIPAVKVRSGRDVLLAHCDVCGAPFRRVL